MFPAHPGDVLHTMHHISILANMIFPASWIFSHHTVKQNKVVNQRCDSEAEQKKDLSCSPDLI